MSKVPPPPINDLLIDDLQEPRPTLSWIEFFNRVAAGNTGEDWSPQFQNLTVSGAAPTILGRFYRISASLVFFRVTVQPGTGGNTSLVQGTGFIENFPLSMIADGACLAVSGLLGSNTAGMVDSATSRVYPPGWTNVTVPVTIIGLVEAR